MRTFERVNAVFAFADFSGGGRQKLAHHPAHLRIVIND
jgi:hypothetical protein